MMKSTSALVLTLALSAATYAQQKPPAFHADSSRPTTSPSRPAEASKTASGLAFIVLQPGTGKTRPAANDLVTVNYTGWTTDGKMFDSSFAHNPPNTFPLDRVIKGWGEGVQLMVAGEKRRFWIPSEIAYNGMAGRPAACSCSTSNCSIFRRRRRTPPPDVAAPPKDAKRTASGLAYKSLRDGKGTTHPNEKSVVTVHYTGWTTDGKMFDTSVGQGPAD
jgi:peptidylprolyl isomerase